MEWIKLDPEDKSTWPEMCSPVVFWRRDHDGDLWWDNGLLFFETSGYSSTDSRYVFYGNYRITELEDVRCWTYVEMPDWLEEENETD